jgi:hypothetical protein
MQLGLVERCALRADAQHHIPALIALDHRERARGISRLATRHGAAEFGHLATDVGGECGETRLLGGIVVDEARKRRLQHGQALFRAIEWAQIAAVACQKITTLAGLGVLNRAE